jgi:hypothetical protein
MRNYEVHFDLKGLVITFTLFPTKVEENLSNFSLFRTCSFSLSLDEPSSFTQSSPSLGEEDDSSSISSKKARLRE